MILRLRLLSSAPISLLGVSCPGQPRPIDFTIKISRLSFGQTQGHMIVAEGGAGTQPILLSRVRPTAAEAERDWTEGFDLRVAKGETRLAIAEALVARKLASDLGAPPAGPV